MQKDLQLGETECAEPALECGIAHPMEKREAIWTYADIGNS